MVREGLSGREIKQILEDTKELISVYIAVETLEYLKKGGRISATTAAVGTLLNIKPILKLGVGLLDTYKNSRGMKKAKKEMLEAIKGDLEQTFREYYEKGEVYLLAASSADEETTRAWVEEIKSVFPGMEVLSGNLSLGVCCHTGPGALGVGVSCRPRR
jgi:DegV family protein with EDD domain